METLLVHKAQKNDLAGLRVPVSFTESLTALTVLLMMVLVFFKWGMHWDEIALPLYVSFIVIAGVAASAYGWSLFDKMLTQRSNLQYDEEVTKAKNSIQRETGIVVKSADVVKLLTKRRGYVLKSEGGMKYKLHSYSIGDVLLVSAVVS